MIQDCEEDQILFLPNFENENKNDSKNKNENINLMKLISNNSSRKDNKIIYNFDEIESTLAAFILPKIKYFKEDIRKVIYQYEIFVGDRNTIIVNFIEKYQQRDLTDEELKSVFNYIRENQKNNKFNIKNFLFSFQVLIDVILDQSPYINNTLLSVALNNQNLTNFDIIIKFLTAMKENEKNNNSFTISTLINLFEVVELFCWDIIRENLDKKYLQDINENIKIQIDKYFEDNSLKKSNNIIKSKIDLCSAIRKFISRYLSGKSYENINPKNNLKIYLINSELWPINYAESDIDDEINQIFGNVDIELAHSVKLYDHLGGDKSILDDILKKIKLDPDKNQIAEKVYKNYCILDNNQIIENAPKNNPEPPQIDQNPLQEEDEANNVDINDNSSDSDNSDEGKPVAY
jgi:hypothetical protein